MPLHSKGCGLEGKIMHFPISDGFATGLQCSLLLQSCSTLGVRCKATLASTPEAPGTPLRHKQSFINPVPSSSACFVSHFSVSQAYGRTHGRGNAGSLGSGTDSLPGVSNGSVWLRAVDTLSVKLEGLQSPQC